MRVGSLSFPVSHSSCPGLSRASTPWCRRKKKTWMAGTRPAMTASDQRLAAGERGGGVVVVGFCRQQHLVMRLAGRNHREAIFQRRNPAIEQHRAFDADHLLDRALQIAGLDGLNP